MNRLEIRRASVSVARSFVLLCLAGTGCDVPPEEDSAIGVVEQAFALPSCESTCTLTGSCNTGCSVTDSQGPVATTCGMYMLGKCEGKDELNPNIGTGDRPPPSGGGGDYNYPPFYCPPPGPYQVTFWEDANFRGRCVVISARGPNGKRGDHFEPWIEAAVSEGGIFYNDRLSAVAVGAKVTLETFNHANFGQSFGTWSPGIGVSYIGNYANDKVSSFKIRVVR